MASSSCDDGAAAILTSDVRWKKRNFIDCAATYHQMVSTLTSNLKYASSNSSSSDKTML
jgi:hypothetical protein